MNIDMTHAENTMYDTAVARLLAPKIYGPCIDTISVQLVYAELLTNWTIALQNACVFLFYLVGEQHRSCLA